MTVNYTTFRSISRVTNWLVRLTIASIILTIILIGGTAYQVLIVEYDPILDNIASISENLNDILLAIVGIITLFWYYWASKNIHSFGAKKVTSPIMAAIWWIVPIFFFWKPYNVTQEMWKVSNPETKLIEGTEWKKAPDSDIVTIWWILGLAVLFSALILGMGFGISTSQQDNFVDSAQSWGTWGTAQILFFAIIAILLSAATIVVEIYFILIIRQISKWQDLKGKTSSNDDKQLIK